MIRKLASIFLIVALLLASACADPVLIGDRLLVAYCNEYITLREEASSQSKALAKIPLGEEVMWLFQSYNGFSYVYYDGKLGFVASKYLELLPNNEIPELSIYLPDLGDDPLPSIGVGSIFEIVTDEPYLVYYDYASQQKRVVLLSGDEVRLHSRYEDNCYVEFEENGFIVPSSVLRLKEGYSANPVMLSSALRYRINDFLSYLTLQDYELVGIPRHAYSRESRSAEDVQKEFALRFLWDWEPQILRPLDEFSIIGGRYFALESGVIKSIQDRFFDDYFYDDYYGEESGKWYSSLYPSEGGNEPYLMHFCEDNRLGYACVDRVNRLENDRYAIRFHVFDNAHNTYDPEFEKDYDVKHWNSNNLHCTPAQAMLLGDCLAEGFAIIHAPNGLESNRDWSLEYYDTDS